MKQIIGLFALLLVIGCSDAGKKNKGCKKSTLYGYVSICLPELKGMVECSEHPNIQRIIEPYLDSGPVLGYYLNDETYKQIDKLGEITYQDYFMLYGDYLRENFPARPEHLDFMQQDLEMSLFGENFERISRTVEDTYGTVTADKPALLEKYSSHPNVRTMVVLMKYKNGDAETSVVSVVDCLLVKNRLLTLAYYLAYDGGKSIDAAKEKNNLFVERLIVAN
ncbi:MAG: hypothetical protein LBH90_04145 [Tannerella sp.]|jgi:hypothetical protein|nr:hypothetical protein [Tannerella sp.]